MKTLSHVSKAFSLMLLVSVATAPAMSYVRSGYNAVDTQARKTGAWIAGTAATRKKKVASFKEDCKSAYFDRFAKPTINFMDTKSTFLGDRTQDVLLFPFDHSTVTKAGFVTAALAAVGYGVSKYVDLDAAKEKATTLQASAKEKASLLKVKAIAAKDAAVEYAQVAMDLAKENTKEAAAVAAVVVLAGYEASNAYFDFTDKFAVSPWAKAGIVKTKDGVVAGFNKTVNYFTSDTSNQAKFEKELAEVLKARAEKLNK